MKTHKEVTSNKSKTLGFVKSKIMKIFRYILLTSLTCTLFSCGPDELIPEPVPPVVNPGDKDEPGEEPEQPEEPAKIQLAITASLQNMQQTRGIIEAFAPGHEMGVFISTGRTDKPAGTKNASYLFDGKVWNAGQDVPRCGGIPAI